MRRRASYRRAVSGYHAVFTINFQRFDMLIIAPICAFRLRSLFLISHGACAYASRAGRGIRCTGIACFEGRFMPGMFAEDGIFSLSALIAMTSRLPQISASLREAGAEGATVPGPYSFTAGAAGRRRAFHARLVTALFGDDWLGGASTYTIWRTGHMLYCSISTKWCLLFTTAFIGPIISAYYRFWSARDLSADHFAGAGAVSLFRRYSARRNARDVSFLASGVDFLRFHVFELGMSMRGRDLNKYTVALTQYSTQISLFIAAVSFDSFISWARLLQHRL